MGSKPTPKELRNRVEKARASLAKLDLKLSRLQSIQSRLAYAQNASERNRAIMQESMNEWIAEFREAHPGEGINYDDLHVDFLLLDEAQNMKNLWPVGRREGGVPKYLGAITEGSDRAEAFAIRAFLTQQETGGSGVALLSATPAKNSPLEFFTLLGYVDHYSWTRRRTYDPENFIDRYLRLEQRTVLKPDGAIESRSAVVGFKAMIEFRDIVGRYSEFRDAKEVGLKLPDSTQQRLFIDMNDEQREKYRVYRSKYESLITSRGSAKQRYEALGILQKMGLVAIHPELDEPPPLPRKEGQKAKFGWTWANAAKVKNKHSPKLDAAVKAIKERPDCGHIVFCDNVAVHRWLFDLLVESGIPAERIAVLNADRAPTPLQRQEIAEAFNGSPAIIDPQTGRVEQEAVPPRYDVVIANAVAYEGIDLQVRTCRIIHLDLPYEPATLQQRNGRGVRQFNTMAVVDIIYILSNKSYDAVKLGMITGKLRWMTDIYKGADRETNNPAAGMEMTPEDLLLMLADDPEAARAALEEVKQRNEREREQQAHARAWQRLGDLLSYLAMARSRDEEMEREQARKQVLATEEYLRAVPADIWPWHFLIDKALAGVPMLTLGVVVAGENNQRRTSTRAVWSGLYMPVGHGRGVYFTAVGAAKFSVREDGNHRWHPLSIGSLPGFLVEALAVAPPATYQTEPPDDSDRVVASLRNAIDELRYTAYKGLGSLGLVAAPDEWRRLVWAEHGRAIVDSLAFARYEAPLRDGDSVRFGRADSFDHVIPATDSGYAEFLQRVEQGRFQYGQLVEPTKKWWGREFPRGVADDRPIADLQDPGGESRRLRLLMAPQSGVSVVELGPRRWALADTNTQQIIPYEFSDLDLAKIGARFLAAVSVGDVNVLDAKKERLLAWLTEQSDLPTLSTVLERYRRTGNAS